MATWPSSLPQSFLLQSTDERLPAVVRFQADAGPAKVRRLFGNASRRMQWRLPPLTQAQREALDTFFISTLAEGSLEFDFIDPSTRVVAQYRFLSPPSYVVSVSPSGPTWITQLEIEILP